MRAATVKVESAAGLVLAGLLAALVGGVGMSGCVTTRAPLQVVPVDGAGARVIGARELSGAFTGTGNEEYAFLRMSGLIAELAVTTPEGITVGSFAVGVPRLLENAATVELIDVLPLGYGRRDALILRIEGGRDGLVMLETQILGVRENRAEVLWAELNCGAIAAAGGAIVAAGAGTVPASTIGDVECEGFEGQARPEFPWERVRTRLHWRDGGVRPERLVYECSEEVAWGDFRATGAVEPAMLQQCAAGLFSPVPGVPLERRDPSWPTRRVAILWRGEGAEAAPTQVESWVHFGDEFRTYGLLGTVRQGTAARDAVVLHVAEHRRGQREESLMVMSWDAPANGFRDQMAWYERAAAIEVIEHDETGLRIRWTDPPPGVTHTGWLRYTADGQVVMPGR